MGIDSTTGEAYIKAQMAAGNVIPTQGGIFISLKDEDKKAALPMVKELVEMGFTIFATLGTSTMLYQAGIKTHACYRIATGRPNVLDFIKEKQISWIINTPEPGAAAMVDEIQMRSNAVMAGITITTTLSGFREALEGIKSQLASKRLSVCSLQEYHRHCS